MYILYVTFGPPLHNNILEENKKMAKEPKQISVISIPLLHAEPWQVDNILKRMELARKMYNSMLSVELKKMHVMERTKRWRENEQRSATIYEKYREMAEKDKTSGKYSKDELKARKEAAEKERKKELKEWNDAWFGSKIEMKESKKDIPDFLKKK